MKSQKVKYIISFVFALSIMSLPFLIQAQELKNPLTGTTGGNLEDAVKNVVNGALGVSGVLALVAFIFGGITWMISGGDSSKIQKGKNMMIWAVLGILIIFSSYVILSYIFEALVGGGSGSNIGAGGQSATNP
ncbi:hypothetical protein GW933_04535 [Candidatus Falkowbacteria bacterium]|uniref:Uncharacterized protein n=1 Tax=Candidatus Buchananbacteria bacterium CG10_big_fil_rev_8_21_14_0_10_33_19 TaxID=1974525 RepID=A0A2H0W4X4_9BACT|nr:hypothetical protein [Candidatus Falkowbacteria bacterium]PIS06402.1 MAG: hypothetical protein COT80_00460 [Candidatus Buchananbacteria bacterium CG10_big_fil_rev_8_21_14_0_10_33_19]